MIKWAYIREQESRTNPILGVSINWGKKKQGMGVGGWIWFKYYVHMYVNEKIIPVETIPGM
jgi:hypothetical protein